MTKVYDAHIFYSHGFCSISDHRVICQQNACLQLGGWEATAAGRTRRLPSHNSFQRALTLRALSSIIIKSYTSLCNCFPLKFSASCQSCNKLLLAFLSSTLELIRDCQKSKHRPKWGQKSRERRWKVFDEAVLVKQSLWNFYQCISQNLRISGGGGRPRSQFTFHRVWFLLLWEGTAKTIRQIIENFNKVSIISSGLLHTFWHLLRS